MFNALRGFFMKKKDRKKFNYYLIFYRSRIYISIMTLFATAIIVNNLEVGIFAIAVVILLILWEIAESEDSNHAVSEYVKEAFLNESLENKSVYDYFPLPFIILNSGNKIERYNSEFEKLFVDMNLLNKSIFDILPDIDIQRNIFDTIINEEYYKIYIQTVKVQSSEKTEFKYILYFWNNTENAILNTLIKREKTVVALIFIDNYDEVLETVEEAKRPILVAIIDKKLNTLAHESEAIVKGFEKDKYLMVMSYEKLEELRDRHFEILTKIREINVGNKIPITLSIGIGLSGDNLAQSMEYARIAVNLALGRGGDQVIIKNVDKYSFFGGNTKEVEKSTQVRARVKAYALKELIRETEHIVIMGHRNPDVDCLGAAIGVFKACQTMGKCANIIVNEITTNISELYKRLISIDRYKKNVFIDSQHAESIVDSKTLLIIVDVHKKNLVEYPQILQKTNKIVVLDHHRMSAEYISNCVLSYIEPYASSTSELVTEILQYLNEKIEFEAVEADALLGGITVDTKNFAVKTGARTFEAAAYLKRVGADSVRVHSLFQNNIKSYRDRVDTVKNAEIFRKNMAISVCPIDAENPSLTAAQAADELLTISGIKASFVISQKNKRVSISARSMGDINVQVIMEKLGGGGHQTVSGAQLNNTDIDAVKSKIKDAILDYFKEE